MLSLIFYSNNTHCYNGWCFNSGSPVVVVGLESIPAVNNPREPKAQASDCFTSLTVRGFFCFFPSWLYVMSESWDVVISREVYGSVMVACWQSVQRVSVIRSGHCQKYASFSCSVVGRVMWNRELKTMKSKRLNVFTRFGLICEPISIQLPRSVKQCVREHICVGWQPLYTMSSEAPPSCCWSLLLVRGSQSELATKVKGLNWWIELLHRKSWV